MVGTLRTGGRALLWMLGGAMLGVLAPVTQVAPKAGFLIGSLGVGAVVGAALFAWMPSWLENRGSKLFSLLYAGYLVGALGVTQGSPVLVAVCVVLVAAVIVRALQAHARPSSFATEAFRLAAAIAWVATIVGIFVYLIGLYVLPLAISLSFAARRSGALNGAERTSALDSLCMAGASALVGVAVGTIVAMAGAGEGGGSLAGVLVFAVTWWYTRRWPERRRAISLAAAP
jgi:hypothetical protein